MWGEWKWRVFIGDYWNLGKSHVDTGAVKLDCWHIGILRIRRIKFPTV